MKRKIETYPYGYIYRGKRTVLLWQTNDTDTFMRDSGNRLIQARTMTGMKKLVRLAAADVRWSEYSEMDFDKFWTALKNLSPNRASSRKTCSVLLSGWNFIEDLGRTLNRKKEVKRLRSKLLNKAYQKLFHGCNLPPTTPKGKSYSPLWISSEIISLRTEFRSVWASFRSQGYIRP